MACGIRELEQSLNHLRPENVPVCPLEEMGFCNNFICAAVGISEAMIDFLGQMRVERFYRILENHAQIIQRT